MLRPAAPPTTAVSAVPVFQLVVPPAGQVPAVRATPAVVDPLVLRTSLAQAVASHPKPHVDDTLFVGLGSFTCLAGVIVATHGVMEAHGITAALQIMGGVAAFGAGFCFALVPSHFLPAWADRRLSRAVGAVAKGWPTPGPDATAEERVVTALLVVRVMNGASGRQLTREDAACVDRLMTTKDIDGGLWGRVSSILDLAFDHRGKVKPSCDVDALAVALASLEAGERTRLVAALKPLIDGLVDNRRASPWREQALAWALEGKTFRYSDVALDAATDTRDPMHPDRLRLDAVSKRLDDQLRERGADANLYGQVRLPPTITRDEAVRLAARYESLGYRAFIHPIGQELLVTVCQDGQVPSTGFIVGMEQKYSAAPLHSDFTSRRSPG